MSLLKRIWEIMAFVVDAFIILERTSKSSGDDGDGDPSSGTDISGDSL